MTIKTGARQLRTIKMWFQVNFLYRPGCISKNFGNFQKEIHGLGPAIYVEQIQNYIP